MTRTRLMTKILSLESRIQKAAATWGYSVEEESRLDDLNAELSTLQNQLERKEKRS